MIQWQIIKDIAFIALNRPQKANALNAHACLSLQQALTQIQTQAKTVVLHGIGKHFCAGADFNWLKPLNAQQRLQALLPLSQALFLLKNGIPSIALVHGACRGGGVGLVSACHTAYASPDAHFACPERSQGIEPAVILPYLQTRISETQLTPWLDRGNVITAENAKQWQLIDHIHWPPTLAASALAHTHKCEDLQ